MFAKLNVKIRRQQFTLTCFLTILIVITLLDLHSNKELVVKMKFVGTFKVSSIQATTKEGSIKIQSTTSKMKAQQKPEFILHMGPHKTGTTYLQNALTYLDNIGTLNSDNYYYVGKHNREMIAKCPNYVELVRHLLGSIGVCDTLKCQDKEKRFAKIIEESYGSKRRNVIVSGEEFSTNVTFTALQKLIPTNIFDVRFVFSYRPYFEWMLSYYHFESTRYRQRWNRPYWNQWPCPPPSSLNTTPPRENCEPTARRSYSFAEYYQRFSDNHFDVNPFTSLYEMIQKTIDELGTNGTKGHLHVMNSYDSSTPDDVGVNFFCRAMDHADRTCDGIRFNDTIKSTLQTKSIGNVNVEELMNDDYLVEYERMAQHAYEIGMVNETLKRDSVVMLIKNVFHMWNGTRRETVRLENKMERLKWERRYLPRNKRRSPQYDNSFTTTIPLQCPKNKQLVQLLTNSIHTEHVVVPSYHHERGGLEALKKKYDDAVSEKLFCNIDLELFFRLPEWNEFLNCLKRVHKVRKCNIEWKEKNLNKFKKKQLNKKKSNGRKTGRVPDIQDYRRDKDNAHLNTSNHL